MAGIEPNIDERIINLIEEMLRLGYSADRIENEIVLPIGKDEKISKLIEQAEIESDEIRWVNRYDLHETIRRLAEKYGSNIKDSRPEYKSQISIDEKLRNKIERFAKDLRDIGITGDYLIQWLFNEYIMDYIRKDKLSSIEELIENIPLENMPDIDNKEYSFKDMELSQTLKNNNLTIENLESVFPIKEVIEKAEALRIKRESEQETESLIESEPIARPVMKVEPAEPIARPAMKVEPAETVAKPTPQVGEYNNADEIISEVNERINGLNDILAIINDMRRETKTETDNKLETKPKDEKPETAEKPEDEKPGEDKPKHKEQEPEAKPEDNKPETKNDSEEPKIITKTEKEIKLINKINELCDKVKEEKNPIKIHILIFKLRMLKEKLDREINLRLIKEEYELKREELKQKRERTKIEALDKLPLLIKERTIIKNRIANSGEYDFQNEEEFMYPIEYVERAGGQAEFIEQLNRSDKTETQIAAQRMEQVNQYREQLMKVQEEIEKQQEILKYDDKDFEEANKNINREEKALIRRTRINSFFATIGGTFRNIRQGIKDYFDAKREDKEIMIARNKDEEEIAKLYERAMKELESQEGNALRKAREERIRKATTEFRNNQVVSTDTQETDGMTQQSSATQPQNSNEGR